jgi:hypothetical protein
MKQKPTHGGARKGAGRKPGKPTVTLAFRVDADKAEGLKKRIKALIKSPD